MHVQKRGRETLLRVPLGTFHVWFGRLLITFGILNGGLGFLYSNSAARGVRITYGIIAGLVWVAFVLGNLLAWEYFKPATGFSLKGPWARKTTGDTQMQDGLQEDEFFEPKA